MKYTGSERVLTVEQLTEAVATDAAGLICAEETRYRTEIRHVAEQLISAIHGRLVVMLSGPSSAGKTTTSHLLQQELIQRGVDTQIVSLDDFYRGRGKAPKLPDGSFDYECIEALDIPQLQRCMRELLTDGCSALPIYDFLTHQPLPQKRQLCLTNRSIVIFEGIHALNPILEQEVPSDKVVRIFVNTLTPFRNGTGKWIARRDVRLIRRLLRDIRFRDSSFEHTIETWKQVARGEELYLFPYAKTVQYMLDTTHAYEPFVFASELLPLLDAAKGSPFSAQLGELADKLRVFPPLPLSAMPEHSLLREFLGA